MSTDRLFIRDRSPSCIRRSASFDPYILRRNLSSVFYDQQVRRSFTPVREVVGLATARYCSSPYGFHYSRPEYPSYYSRARTTPPRELYRSSSLETVMDYPYYPTNYSHNLYVPSGWSGPIYRYLHPYRSYRNLARVPSHGYAQPSTYSSPYGTVYRPPPVYSSHNYYTLQQSKKYDWRKWLDSGQKTTSSYTASPPWYRSFYGQSGPGPYDSHWTSSPEHYFHTAVWVV